MSESAIVVEDLVRRYGSGAKARTALDGVCFDVPVGQIVALLGVNGAGKTTLVKVLSTLLLPTAGTARVLGKDVVRESKTVRGLTGVVFGGERGLYSRVSGRDNLRFFGMLAGLGRAELRARIPVALEQVNLTSAADRRVETYSRGMRQRLHLAIGLVARPRVLLLDEPTIGLDPIEAERLRGIVSGMRYDGTTVLLTSHYLLDVERLADRILLLADGCITRDMTPAEFSRESGSVATVTVSGGGALPDLAVLAASGVAVISSQNGGESWQVKLSLPDWNRDVFNSLTALCGDSPDLKVQVSEARLEDAFALLSALGKT